MKITGKYIKDDNFITLFSNGTIYTIARNSDDWGAVSIGEKTAMGVLVTPKNYAEYEKRAEKSGTFTLDEEQRGGGKNDKSGV